jgi:hypothetical protein
LHDHQTTSLLQGLQWDHDIANLRADTESNDATSHARPSHLLQQLAWKKHIGPIVVRLEDEVVARIVLGQLPTHVGEVVSLASDVVAQDRSPGKR